MIGGSLFYDFARVGATPALFQSFVLSAGVVTDYVYGAGMHWQAMFPMIAVQRYLGEASAGTRLDDQRQPGHIPRGWALLLHLWCGSTLCRSRGHTIFASALADSRMGAPTPQRPPHGNNSPFWGRTAVIAGYPGARRTRGIPAPRRDRPPLYPRKRTSSDTTGVSALCQSRPNAPQQKSTGSDC